MAFKDIMAAVTKIANVFEKAPPNPEAQGLATGVMAAAGVAQEIADPAQRQQGFKDSLDLVAATAEGLVKGAGKTALDTYLPLAEPLMEAIEELAQAHTQAVAAAAAPAAK